MGLPATLVLEDIDKTIQADFISGTLKLVDGTFEERTAPVEGGYRHVPFGAQATFDNYGLVVTSFQLVGVGNTPALVGEINKIEKLFENARKWNSDPLRYSSTWLRWGAKDETTSGYKRALIFEGSMSFVSPSGQNVSPFMQAGQVRINIRVTRHPFYENDVIQSDTSGGGLTIGHKYIPTAFTIGTAPARIIRMALDNTSASGSLDNFWAGIRNNVYGASSFTPVWEAEAGTNGTDAADVVDAAASGGNRVDITPGTTTLVQRWSQVLSTASGSSDPAINKQYAGRYLVLGRFQLSAGSSTWGIQLRYGYTLNAGAGQIPCEKVYFTDTSWRLIELGEVIFPITSNRAKDFTALGYKESILFSQSALFLWAERISGAANLRFDAIVLIPSESIVIAKSVGVGIADFVYIDTAENDVVEAYVDDGNSANISTRNVYWPGGADGGVMVMAAERATEHLLSDTMRVTLNIVPRWLSYRS
jgi:hypothetical protein